MLSGKLATMFEDRKDAGRQLAGALEQYRGRNVLVLAIPRGGVEVGYEIARALDAELAVAIVRKLPFPDEPEAGFGAIAEDGSVYMTPYAELMPETVVESVLRAQRKEIERRVKVLRGGRPLPEIRGRTVILVDDGIAMGSTMRACISMCGNLGAAEIVVAVPVTGSDRAEEIGRLVDRAVVLETPPGFRAVAQAYRNWYDVPDEEVLDIMERYEAGR
jgi:putative phosphoribosyl transferase